MRQLLVRWVHISVCTAEQLHNRIVVTVEPETTGLPEGRHICGHEIVSETEGGPPSRSRRGNNFGQGAIMPLAESTSCPLKVPEGTRICSEGSIPKPLPTMERDVPSQRITARSIALLDEAVEVRAHRLETEVNLARNAINAAPTRRKLGPQIPGIALGPGKKLGQMHNVPLTGLSRESTKFTARAPSP